MTRFVRIAKSRRKQPSPGSGAIAALSTNMPSSRFIVIVLLAACAPDVRDVGPDAATSPDSGSNTDPSVTCDQTPAPATGATINAAYAQHYKLFTLGPVPGVPAPLGGSVISSSDPDTLLIAGGSEGENGAIYAIKVKRNGCGHIYAFDGTAQLKATTPYVDASLVYTPNHVLLFTEWPDRKSVV